MQTGDNNSMAVGLQAVSYVISEDTLRDRFMAVSGVDSESIRERLSEPDFLVSVLDFLIQHEPDLIDFAESSKLPPEQVVGAWRSLGGGIGQEW